MARTGGARRGRRSGLGLMALVGVVLAAMLTQATPAGAQDPSPMRRRSPTISSAGASNTFSAPPPPTSRIVMRGWSSRASISNVTSAPNALT